MGNVFSKKRKARPRSVIREPSDIPENELTATSFSSILINNNNNNENQPVNNGQDDESSSNHIAANQMTVTSMRSFGKNIDIDECISRLIEVGSGAKIPKSICFRNSEIVAICRAAQEVFLSQPVSNTFCENKGTDFFL
jgi:serine/threonine-protein phosphatase PP1 catalytic subunit